MSQPLPGRTDPAPQGVAWERVMTLSGDMLASARAGDWERVCTLQEERIGLIRQYFAADPSAAELDRIRPQVNGLLDMDAEVAALGMRRRTALGEELRQIRRGRTVRKAYGGQSGR